MGIYLLWILGLCLLFFFLYVNRLHRERDVRALADRLGLHYLGEGVPRSLSLHGTGLVNATSIWNLIDGERRGIRVIAFDCQIGHGRGSWRRTAIAVESEDPQVFGAI